MPLLPGRPEALSLAVAGHTQPADHRPDAVTIGDRAGERLDDERHVALGRNQAVGGLAERARAGIAHRLGRRKEHEAVRLAVGGSADDGLVDASLQERPGTDRHRLQRRGAGGIHHEKGPVEFERLLHDLRGADRPEIEILALLPPGIPPPDGRGHLGTDSVHVATKDRPSRVDLGKECRRLVNAGGVDDVADPCAATSVAHVDTGATIGGHREGIHAGITACQ